MTPEYWRRSRVYPRAALRAIWRPLISKRRRNALGWPPSADLKSIADAGAGADALAIAASVPISDAGAGAEGSFAIPVSFSLAEGGAGADAVAALSASLSVADAAGGLDGIGILQESAFPVPLWHRLLESKRIRLRKQLT